MLTYVDQHVVEFEQMFTDLRGKELVGGCHKKVKPIKNTHLVGVHYLGIPAEAELQGMGLLLRETKRKGY